MKKSLVACVLFAVAIASPGFCGDTKEMSPEQTAWMEYMTPGWAHELLAKSAGKWKTESKFWLSPEMPPEVNKGTAEAEMILGGRYLKTTYTSKSSGQPYSGMGLEGYDNARKEFVSTWIDNMGTGIATGIGKISEDKKSIEYKGKMTDPLTKNEIETRSVVKFINDDKTVFEMFVTQEGREYKTMEIVYTRAK